MDLETPQHIFELNSAIAFLNAVFGNVQIVRDLLCGYNLLNNELKSLFGDSKSGGDSQCVFVHLLICLTRLTRQLFLLGC